jgi:DNA-binding NtrC family response regulator
MHVTTTRNPTQRGPSDRPPSPAETEHLLVNSLEALGGATLVLDAGLRVVVATPGAERLLGAHVAVGAHGVKILCGDESERPLAEALAAGRPATGLLRRPRGNAERLVRVRTRPLRPLAGPGGWLVLLVEEAAPADDAPEEFHGMWTRDVTMKHLLRLAERVAPCEASVLLQGESGTGKGSLAAAIHALSHRHAGPFVAVDCAASSPTLLERRLVRAARRAHGGTLFLDDVEELPLDLQPGLVRLLEVGASPADGRKTPLDVRVIAATQASLPEEVARGRFRPDLMYALRIVSLHVPPLRARRGDAVLLAEKLVAGAPERGRRVRSIGTDARLRLEQHGWPGNVRELRAAIASALAVGAGPVLGAADLPAEVSDDALGGGEVVLPPPAPGREEADEGRIRRAIRLAGGDRVRAAAMLGLSRTTLWRRMRALGLLDANETGERSEEGRR